MRVRIAQHCEHALRIVAPLGEQFRELRGGVSKCAFVGTRQPAHQRFTLAVVLPDHAALIDDDKTVLHVADDELVDLRQIGQVHTARFGDLFGTARVLGKCKTQTGNDKIAARKQSTLEKIRCGRLGVQKLPGLLEQDRQRRHRRVKKCMAPSRHQTGRCETNKQQQTNTAFHTPRGVHQHRHRDYIEDNLPGEMVGHSGETCVRGGHHCRGCNEIKCQRPAGQRRRLRT